MINKLENINFDEILKEKNTLRPLEKYDTKKIIYSEKTKEMFSQYTPSEAKGKNTTNRAEKKIGTPNQKRGSGRGCM